MTFDNTEIEKRTFYYFKHTIDINNVNIDKIVISDKISFGKKGIGKGDEKVKPLCMMPSRMSGYAKGFDETKYMSFLTEDEKLLKAYNK